MTTTIRGIAAFALLCLCIVGCSRESKTGLIEVEKTNTLFGIRNVRDYLKGNVRFRSKPIENGNNYSYLLVGCPAKPYAGIPAVRVNLPDGTILNLAETNIVQMLKQKTNSRIDLTGTVFYDIGSPSMDLYGKWPAETLELQFENRSFWVHDDQLIAFRVVYNDYAKDKVCDTVTQMGGSKSVIRRTNIGSVPTIGKSDEEKTYVFPLTQEEVIHVFGLPDKITESFQE